MLITILSDLYCHPFLDLAGAVERVEDHLRAEKRRLDRLMATVALPIISTILYMNYYLGSIPRNNLTTALPTKHGGGELVGYSILH
jgi:hypothetical protein